MMLYKVNCIDCFLITFYVVKVICVGFELDLVGSVFFYVWSFYKFCMYIDLI